MTQIFSKNRLSISPWKNGGGQTREIATAAAGRPFWRVSIADVDRDGPFSTFPGLSRILTVIQGNGMSLKDGQHSFDALLFEPTRFNGEQHIHGHLFDGPVQNFNLIFDPQSMHAQVLVGSIPRLKCDLTVDCDVAMIYCLAGTLRTSTAGELRAHDGVFLTDPADFEASSDADHGLWIGLTEFSK